MFPVSYKYPAFAAALQATIVLVEGRKGSPVVSCSWLLNGTLIAHTTFTNVMPQDMTRSGCYWASHLELSLSPSHTQPLSLALTHTLFNCETQRQRL